jgi:hypothetical protein
VFERSIEDLLAIIRQFENSAADGGIFDRASENELKRFEESVQKELFATTNAAQALVEHSTRRLQKSINIPGYGQRLAECFGDDGLHECVIGLRKIIHHINMVQSGWQITRQADTPKWHATFKLNTDELMLHAKSGNMKSEGRRFIANAPHVIDLKLLFEEYRRRVREFHSWFTKAIDARPLADIQDYERCLRQSRNNATRMLWKAMLGNWLMNWSKPPNPYEYLNRYLNSDQLRAVHALPAKSKEQVDKIIEFIDTDGACDDELRELAYELFRRAI